MNKNSVNIGRLALCATCLILSACSSSDRIEKINQNRDIKTSALPMTNAPSDLPMYRIQIGDVLDLKMLTNPELSEDLIVRPDGMISTTLVQDVAAYGKTPKELQTQLTELYRNELKDPKLTIIVKSFAPTRIYVMGEVQNPGELVFIGPNLTLMQAIARAGGVKTTAKGDAIVVMRRGANDKPEIYKADFDSASTGVDPTDDIRLAPFDVVFVPRSSIAEANVIYDQYIRSFVSPSIGVNYSVNNN